MNEDLKRIVEVCSASDGGPDLIHLRSFVDDMESRAMSGNDYAAEEIMKIIHTFRKLVDVATVQR